jgi:hypothetical protein
LDRKLDKYKQNVLALEQQVQFEPGENRKSCVVPLQQDERHQGQKQLDLQLAEPSYALLG